MTVQANTVGGPLDDIYKDLKLLPTNVLQSYLQNPNNMQADGVSFSLMAGGVLADRARQQAAFAASQQPNPAQIPTVAQTLAQGQPVGIDGVPAGGAGITAFAQQAQQGQQPQSQQITLNPAKQATPISLATPYAAAKTPLQQKVSAAPTATRNMAQGGIVAFNGEDDSYVQRTNREAHERGVREPDPELAAIRNIDERNRRRLEKYGPPRDPVMEGLASMGAVAKDVLSYPVRAIGAAANKYLPIPDIPESFFGGDRSSMTPYMDQLRRGRAQQATSDEATVQNNPTYAATKPTPTTTPTPTPSPAATTPTSTTASVSHRISTSGADAGGERQAPTSSQEFPTLQEMYKLATTPGPRQLEHQKALIAYQKFIQESKPFAIDEAERNRITGDKFQEFQNVSKPYYEKMQGLLEEERAAAQKSTAGDSSLVRFGLGLMGHRGSLASGIGKSGIAALDYYDKAKQSEAEALREARKGEMALIRSRMADERGDRTAAQAFLNTYQQSKEKEQQAEFERQKSLVSATELSAREEGRGTRDTVDVMSRVITAEEARKTREQIAADAVAQRRDAASMRAEVRAAAASGKLDPLLAQRSKFIGDRIDTVDKEIAALSKQLFIPENKAKVAALNQQRSQLEKAWGDLLGYTLPTTGAAGSADAGWVMKPIK